MKKIILILCVGLLFGGCASKTLPNNVPETVNMDESSVKTETSSEENIENNNSEIKDAGTKEENETVEENKELNVAETVADDSDKKATKGVTVEKCPLSASDKRTTIEYGNYIHETYYSTTCGMERGYNVLLPENYDENKTYSVFYFLHGVFGDENSFPSDPANKVKEIFYNLAADGEARQWIVIMPAMFATNDKDMKPSLSAEGLEPYDNFINDLVNDLMPVIEERYPVYTDREHTAIAGFSLGGRETLYISLSRPDLFAYAGAISPAPGLVPGKDWAMEHPGTVTEADVVYPAEGEENAMTVLMVMCGTSDKVVGRFPKSYHELMDKNGVSHMWYEVTGADHDNTAIKSGLYNFLIQIDAQ